MSSLLSHKSSLSHSWDRTLPAGSSLGCPLKYVYSHSLIVRASLFTFLIRTGLTVRVIEFETDFFQDCEDPVTPQE